MGKNKSRPLSLKLSAILLLIGLCIGLSALVISDRIYYNRTISRYAEQGEVLINYAAKFVNWDQIGYYFETLDEDDEYRQTLETMRLLCNGAGAEYLFVLIPVEGGAVFVFDTDESEDRCPLGFYWPWPDIFLSESENLTAGNPIGPIVSDVEYGWLLSFYLPFYNSAGEFAGYLGVDYSEKYIMEQQWEFMVPLIVVTLLASGIMMVVFLVLLQRTVLRPINEIADAAKNFVVGNNGFGKENSITTLTINTKDELQSLSEALKTMERKTQESIESLAVANLRAQADPMTGLLNRESFETEIRRALANGNESEICFFMMLDIDNFKNVNDTYGHAVGDDVIIACAQAIGSNFRENDLVARMGGDEFAIFCKGIKSNQDIERRAAGICESVREIRVEGGMAITVSIGVAVTEAGRVKYREFYINADSALYEAKESGKDRYVIHYMKSPLPEG